MKERFKRYFAELFGTMFLVLFGCGTCMAVGINSKQGSGYILTALAFGLVYIAMYYGVCKKSGCHINPAVSLAMLLLKKMDAVDFAGYVICQFAGGFAACGLLTAIFYGHTSSYGANVFYDDNPWISLLIEVILTLVFISVVIVLTCSEKQQSSSGLLIGLTLTLVHIFGIQLTGTSVNPARSLAPAIFAGEGAVGECWVFVLAPFIASVLAFALCKWLVLDNVKKNDNGEEKEGDGCCQAEENNDGEM